MEGGPNRKIKLDRSPGVDEVNHLFKIYTVTFCIYRHFFVFYFRFGLSVWYLIDLGKYVYPQVTW